MRKESQQMQNCGKKRREVEEIARFSTQTFTGSEMVEA